MATTPILSSPGIGSGLDVNAIVDKLMAVYRPIMARTIESGKPDRLQVLESDD